VAYMLALRAVGLSWISQIFNTRLLVFIAEYVMDLL